jgi:NADPH-dependent 2,4-dienoyl-CoA reductase/sulfur reductase-like enzyme
MRIVIVGGSDAGISAAPRAFASRPEAVLTTVEPQLGEVIGQELATHGVQLWRGVTVSAIQKAAERLKVISSGGEERTADLVIVATVVRPDTDLGRTAGLELGKQGAIKVSRGMETTVPGIYAAGDCVETWHRVREGYTYLPLGTTSHKQGRVAGENAAGGNATFAGVVGTQVVKVFGLAIARTGLLDREAQQAGFEPVTIAFESCDHKVYYPGATKLHLRVTGDRNSARLLGAQMVGSWKAEVSKRIDIFATALRHGMNVDELNDLDLSYTPPLSSPWDPVQMSAQAWCRAVKTTYPSQETIHV